MSLFFAQLTQQLRRGPWQLLAIELVDGAALRACGSQLALWQQLGVALSAEGLWPATAADFVAARQRAQRQLLAKGISPSIYGCYQCMPLAPDLAAQCAERELALEAAGLIALPGLERVLAQHLAADAALVVSDDGYPSAWLEQCFCRLFPLLAPRLRRLEPALAGSSLGQRLAVTGVAASATLMIGRQPLAALTASGLTVSHWPQLAQVGALSRREQWLAPELQRLDSYRRAVAAHDPGMAGWSLGAALLAPVFWSYAQAVVAMAKRYDCPLIAPVVRDGHALALALAAVTAGQPQPPAVRLLELSRAALWLAAQQSLAPAALLNSALSVKGVTVADLWQLLGLTTSPPVDVAMPLAAAAGHGSLLRQPLEAALAVAATEITHNQQQQRQRLQRYVDQQWQGQRVLVVDLGGGGSILSMMVASGLTPAAAMLFYATRRADGVPAALPLASYLPVDDARGQQLAEQLGRSPEVLESLMVNRFATIEALAGSLDQPEPQRAAVALSGDEQQLLDGVWQGLGDGLQLLAGQPALASALAAIEAQAMASVWLRLINLPLLSELKLLQPLRHQDNAGARRCRPLWSDAAVKVAAADPLAFWHRHCANPGQQLDELPWPQAVVTWVAPQLLAELAGALAASPAEVAAEQLAARVEQQGIDQVLLYGGGMVAEALLPLLQQLGVKVEAVVDRRALTGSHQLAGYPLLPPTALAGATTPVVIASAAAVDEMMAQVRQLAPACQLVALTAATGEG